MHIPRPRKEYALPLILSQRDIQRLIEHGSNFKNQVFMSLLYATGLRLSEALNLRLGDIKGDRLHSAVVYKKIKDQIPDQLKRNGRTVRSVIQILKVLLTTKPYKCEHCGGTDFEIDPIQSDYTYLVQHILHKERGPPPGQADTKGSSKTTLSQRDKAMNCYVQK